MFGSPSWTRTNDPAVNSRMLYRLSYRGIYCAIHIAYIDYHYKTYLSNILPKKSKKNFVMILWNKMLQNAVISMFVLSELLQKVLVIVLLDKVFTQSRYVLPICCAKQSRCRVCVV